LEQVNQTASVDSIFIDIRAKAKIIYISFGAVNQTASVDSIFIDIRVKAKIIYISLLQRKYRLFWL
jgi:uncharacterized protein YuzE